MDFITGRLEDNPSLDEIAEAGYFSKFHFHRMFHALVGETAGQFTRRLRLEKAANLLIYAPAKDITAVSLD
jgi:AraC family transcriptional regulator